MYHRNNDTPYQLQRKFRKIHKVPRPCFWGVLHLISAQSSDFIIQFMIMMIIIKFMIMNDDYKNAIYVHLYIISSPNEQSCF